MINPLLDNNFLNTNLEQLPYHEIVSWISLCRKRLAERSNPNIHFFEKAKEKLEQEQSKRIINSFFKKKQN